MVSIKLPGLSRRNLIRFTGCFLLILFMFLVLARFIDFPVSMFVVGGRSMEPTLYIGDLVLGVKGNYTVGDIVVVGGTNRVNCIVHRVFSVTGSQVTTKGDANPGPDNPIDRRYVLYRVVLIISRLLWIPPLFAAIAVFLYRYFRGLIQGVEIGRTMIAVVIFFSVLDIIVMTAIPFFHVHQSIDLRRPSITLRSITLSGDFRTLVAVYNVDMLSLLRVEESSIRAAGRDFKVENCSVEGDVLKMSVPKGIYEALYLNATSEVSSFWAYCTIILDKGVLYGFYPVTFNWKRLEVSVENNTMMVSNPNPVLLKASVEIQYYGLDRFGRLTYLNSEFFQAVFEPASTLRIRPTGEGVTSYVILKYVFLNSSIVESKRVDLVGG